MIRPAVIQEMKKITGNTGVFTNAADLTAYSYDAATVDPQMPEVVARPRTTVELGKLVSLCNAEKLPLIVRGAGTNLAGGTVPVPGAVVLLTNALNNILEINAEDMYAVVEPGVITAHLAAQVQAQGLFYPPDPGSQAVSTLGGNVAENAGGLRGLKYGVTRDYVMGLTFFDCDGGLVKTGSRTVKCATGYNLAGLMVGSEGTLGVMSEITLKLLPQPADRTAMIAVYDQTEKASESVAAIIAAHIIPATLEFMDNFTIRAVETFSSAGMPTDAAALLLIEVDGHPAQVAEEAEKISNICRNIGALKVKVARDAVERDTVWAARRSALSALAKLRPTVVLEDATVPRSKIPQMVAAIQDVSRKYQIPIGTFGHAGDGNLHPTILTDKRDQAEWGKVESVIDDIFDAALSLGGTLSGEHGIGSAKRRYLEKEVGRKTIEWSRQIKKALDPNGILNPEKVIGGYA
jgi:glycolate oxidase